jgi:hypothetical protein
VLSSLGLSREDYEEMSVVDILGNDTLQILEVKI